MGPSTPCVLTLSHTFHVSWFTHKYCDLFSPLTHNSLPLEAICFIHLWVLLISHYVTLTVQLYTSLNSVYHTHQSYTFSSIKYTYHTLVITHITNHTQLTYHSIPRFGMISLRIPSHHKNTVRLARPNTILIMWLHSLISHSKLRSRISVQSTHIAYISCITHIYTMHSSI